jgi:predicted transcriptional regulator YheO
MGIIVLALTGIVALLCINANASDFPPMRGLLVLVQTGLVLVRASVNSNWPTLML